MQALRVEREKSQALGRKKEPQAKKGDTQEPSVTLAEAITPARRALWRRKERKEFQTRTGARVVAHATRCCVRALKPPRLAAAALFVRTECRQRWRREVTRLCAAECRSGTTESSAEVQRRCWSCVYGGTPAYTQQEFLRA